MPLEPTQEEARLRVLHGLDVLDTEPEPEYDDLVALAAAICGTPVAILNLVDRDRQWGKALIGQKSSEAPLHVSFCSRTILEPSGIMVIPDARLDARFSANPLVVADTPPLLFYAGASIVTDGHRLGTVCVVDHEPRELEAPQLEALSALARQAGAQFTLRRRTRDLEDANAELRHLALHDGLTGLPNRTLVLDRIEGALRRARRSGMPPAVLFCDVDGFKAVNDTLGHEQGDDVLRSIAGHLVDAARGTDTVGRLAGDEFVVLCEAVGDEDEAHRVADRLRAATDHLAGGISVGVAMGLPGDSADQLLARADAAMYAQKPGRTPALTQPS